MVDVKMNVETKVSARKRLQLDRLARIAAAKPKAVVRVIPRDEDVRRVLKHPNGMKFRPTGSIEWPLDKFTQRRIEEGVITVENGDDQPKKAATKEPHGV